MGYLQLGAVLLLALFALKAWNGWKHEAQARGIAVAEKQIADSIVDTQKDSQREINALLAKRPERAAVLAKVQAKRKADDVQQRKTDPAYGDWANRPVPQSVVDRLRESARTANGVRGDPSNGAARPAVRPDSTGAASKDGRWRLGPLRSGGA